MMLMLTECATLRAWITQSSSRQPSSCSTARGTTCAGYTSSATESVSISRCGRRLMGLDRADITSITRTMIARTIASRISLPCRRSPTSATMVSNLSRRRSAPPCFVASRHFKQGTLDSPTISDHVRYGRRGLRVSRRRWSARCVPIHSQPLSRAGRSTADSFVVSGRSGRAGARK